MNDISSEDMQRLLQERYGEMVSPMSDSSIAFWREYMGIFSDDITCAEEGCKETDDLQRCQECGTLLCFEHRRDFPCQPEDPTHPERYHVAIYCIPCLQKRKRIYVYAHNE